ncbi:hypothetical protein [Candidatus Spongiihabitans sp.]|uniref:hypothetical protein n=1 Tax=Candidatus Spongiihabitans sp. TaxID=3101308 RepID=UPI003C7A2B2A
MPKPGQPTGISIEEIGRLYNRAEEHHLYLDKENKESRNLEAFLMLATLFEGVLVAFGLAALENGNEFNSLLGKRMMRESRRTHTNFLRSTGSFLKQ